MRLRIAVVAFTVLGGLALTSTAASAMPNGMTPKAKELVGQTSNIQQVRWVRDSRGRRVWRSGPRRFAAVGPRRVWRPGWRGAYAWSPARPAWRRGPVWAASPGWGVSPGWGPGWGPSPGWGVSVGWGARPGWGWNSGWW
jgi:hypothetical protein